MSDSPGLSPGRLPARLLGSAGLTDRAAQHGDCRRCRRALRAVLRRTHPRLQEHRGSLEDSHPDGNALHGRKYGRRMFGRGCGRGLWNEGGDSAPERTVTRRLSRGCGHPGKSAAPDSGNCSAT